MYQPLENNQQPNLTPMDLLRGKNWLRQAADFEDEVGGNIGVGLGWDAPLEVLTLNPDFNFSRFCF